MYLNDKNKELIEKNIIAYYKESHTLSVNWVFVIQDVTMQLSEVQKKYIELRFKYGKTNKDCVNELHYSKRRLQQFKQQIYYDILVSAARRGITEIKEQK